MNEAVSPESTAPDTAAPAAGDPVAESEAVRLARQAGAALTAAHRAAHQAAAAGQTEAALQAFSILAGAIAVPADSRHALGAILLGSKRNAEALPHLQAAIALQPGNASFHSNLGIALRRLGRPAEAEACYRKAMALEPGHLDVAKNLANLMRDEGRIADAEAAFRSALTIAPTDRGALIGLSGALLQQSKYPEAEKFALRAVELEPASPEALSALSMVRQREGRLLEALEDSRAALRHLPTPRLDMPLADMLSLAGRIGDFDERRSAGERTRQAVAQPREATIDASAYRRFAYLFPYYGIPDDGHLMVLSRLGEELARARSQDRLPPRPRSAKIRIGYLSGNFGDHPIGHLLSPVFELHDRDRFETVLISLARRDQDPDSAYRARLERSADRFVELEGVPLEECVQRIRDERIDVLVDLSGYLHGGWAELLARRVAPVQVHWIMHLAGMPAPFIDYSLVDTTMVPDLAALSHAGPTVRLPDAFQSGDPRPVPDSIGTRARYDLPEQALVFCGFNNRLKIDEDTFALWMSILRQAEGSVLWLSGAPDRAADDQFRTRAQALGVDPSRLVMAGRVVDKGQHLARHKLADLFLDTLKFSAATTATDALWTGLPVVTTPGTTSYGRLGASILRASGLGDTVQPDLAAYERTAIELAKDPARLAALRQRVAATVPGSNYFNPRLFASQLESAWRGMMDRHWAGLPPAHFDVV